MRSSSVLEDSFGATFSGIYRSIFLHNQGSLEECLAELTGAIAEIYAGVFSPDALSYRKRHDLIDYDERMGVMLQPVVGSRRGKYFLPQFAGVAFSRNDNRWSLRIQREDGMMRIVLGLGTHAVDRVGDYARMVALKAPTIRPEGSPEEIVRASQKHVDVIDLAGGGFRGVPAAEILDLMREEGIADFVSVMEPDGRLSQPFTTRVTADVKSLCVTFDRLLNQGEWPKRMHRILKRLEEAYHVPIDMEFAVERDELYVLQCRPLVGSGHKARAILPRDIADEDRVFTANRYVNNGQLIDLRYVVLIDPRDYRMIDSVDRRLELARTIGRVNDQLQGERFMLMGPGRWGSQNVQLGVQVSYADICHSAALIEIARSQDGYTPEPSFGTHFFQDLVEDGILYLPLYPGDNGAEFNESFFHESPNALARISPKDAHQADVVRVIDVREARPGRTLSLVMDGELQDALCYLS